MVTQTGIINRLSTYIQLIPVDFKALDYEVTQSPSQQSFSDSDLEGAVTRTYTQDIDPLVCRFVEKVSCLLKKEVFRVAEPKALQIR
jgi:hypothetical protein